MSQQNSNSTGITVIEATLFWLCGKQVSVAGSVILHREILNSLSFEKRIVRKGAIRRL